MTSSKNWTISQILVNLDNFHLQSFDKTIRILRNCVRLCAKRSPIILKCSSRQQILPVFPELNDFDEFYPLLANLSYERLSDKERVFRTNHRYQRRTIDISFNRDDIEMGRKIQKLLNFYSQKWHIDQDVLIVNLQRLLTSLSRFILNDFILKHQQQLCQFSIEEWFIALEFYLQMDAQCFFMKTCSFRQAIPRCIDEGIFSLTLPSTQYGMKQCQDQNCHYCYKRLDFTDRFEPAKFFSTSQIHHFVNGYHVYLNCNVTCTSSNIIYALTCPCHQYDFIGRCRIPFGDRIMQHRLYNGRIISNFFIGQTVADHLRDEHTHLTISESHTKLYQHAIQCPVTIEMFLKIHPRYWCFVPMTREQAIIDDMNLTSTERNLLVQYQMSHSEYNVQENSCNTYQRSDNNASWCMNNGPSAPLNYQFSLRQKLDQWEFFRDRSDIFTSRYINLYNPTIVMALPDNSSDEMRHLIQALLVSHAEPKLNRTINDSILTSANSNNNNNNNWYQHLIHPRLRFP
ncbi:unnamed protein product [Adineta steineri]|uniref:Uncharacterized protein n=1 Tax=Adineta steineri TaxID=433720 RepID=A0A819FVS9_9BILA|nr:unnamed protein product [Adineta steineri]CAF3874835.1 unnamed protein product [Adineta steineri]CAF4039973.1 unnamed protein product [Adineta steineri]